MQSAVLAAVVAFSAWVLTWAHWRTMKHYRRLEEPSGRGMHTVPVVTGAGWAVILVALVAWPVSTVSAFAGQHTALLAGAAFLTAVSCADDHKGGLSPAFRLSSQGIVAAVLLLSLGEDSRIAPTLPLPLERLFLWLGWLWFINLFNFMDGIDGLAGSEAIFVALGYSLIVAAQGADSPLATLGLTIAAATAGYLIWNWHPARIMMGDTGSIPLGFLLGWLMIDLAFRGYWAAAIILPLYFLVDATITLSVRMIRGEKPWIPHREHAYQRAVLNGNAPSSVVGRVSVANLALLLLALVSTWNPALGLSAAAVVVSLLMFHLRHLAGRSSGV